MDKEIRYVAHERVEEMLREGWIICDGNLEGTCHGEWSVLMERPYRETPAVRNAAGAE